LTPQSADFATKTEASPEALNRRPGTLALVVIALITGWAFLPVLQNGFVDGDEKTLINNFAYRGLGWSELRWMFAGFHFGTYQPFTWLTFGLDHVVWWTDPFGYHLTNLLLHAGNATGVYLLALELFSFPRSDTPQSDTEILRLAAGLSALIFAIHPLHVEPVAWASARSEILATLFFLCSILFYLKAVRMGQANRGQARWMILSMFTYCLSLLSGMSGIALPGVLLVLDVYPLGRFARSENWFSPEARRLYKEKIPYFLLALIGVVVALIASHVESFVGETFGEPVMTEVALYVAAPVFHFWKAFVSFGLSPAYELRGWVLALGACASLAVTLWLYVIRKRWPALLASWICYLMLLWLVPDRRSLGWEMLADRRAYLASIPWVVLTGAAAIGSWQAYTSDRIRPSVLFAGVVTTAMILFGLGALTSSQTRLWRDSATLWRNAAARSDASKAHYNLALLQEAQGKYDDAIESYKQVTKVDPRRWDAHEKAALLLQKQGKIREAVVHYRQVVQINPGATETRNNLASGLVTLGELGEATQHYRKILEHTPERNDVRVKLATILALQGSLIDAADLFQQAVDRDPKDAKTLLRLGQVLAARGALDRAIQYFRQAAQIQPEDAEVQEGLGRALLELGKRDEAAKHLQEAVRILKSSPVQR